MRGLAVVTVENGLGSCRLADKARFAYDGLRRQRLVTPMIKANGVLQPVDWEAALLSIGKVLKWAGKNISFSLPDTNLLILKFLPLL